MRSAPRAILLTHLAATLLMVGTIWFVQVVHYPLFDRVGEPFESYQGDNIRLSAAVVAPVMIVEGLTAVLLLIRRPEGVGPRLIWLGLSLLAIIWISTAALQMPQHEILARGFDASAHRSLVATNWIRTAAWSARGLLVIRMAAAGMK